jgi:hypothetical protein
VRDLGDHLRHPASCSKLPLQREEREELGRLRKENRTARRRFATKAEARMAIFEFIEG